MSRPCPGCGGYGTVLVRPVPGVRRRWPGPDPANDQGADPGRRRGRHAHPAGRRGRGRPGRRAARRPVPGDRAAPARDLRAAGRRPALHGDDPDGGRGARRDAVGGQPGRARRHRHPSRYPVRPGHPALRPGRQAPERHRTRRPRHPRDGGDARPGSTRSRRSCSASWPSCAARSRLPASSPPASRASSPGCATPSTGADAGIALPQPPASWPAGPNSATTDVLSGAEGRHAAAVRRLRPGERADVGDGAGLVAECVVAGVQPDQAGAGCAGPAGGAPRRTLITVVQAIPKGDRGELAVEEMTEVGVDRIVPVGGRRARAGLAGRARARSLARWRAKAREAAKQSRRAVDTRGDRARVTLRTRPR